jgi:hypothetical protein
MLLLTNKNDILYKLFTELNNTILELSKILSPLSTKSIFIDFHDAVMTYTNINYNVNLTLQELASSKNSANEKQTMLIAYLNNKLNTKDKNN